MPSFDDSFLSYCERAERKRKHSYNFNTARNSSGGSNTQLSEKGGRQHQQLSGSRGNLLATAKSYSKTLPRSFRKNLQKISQYIRESGEGDFYDLNHNELSAVERVGTRYSSGDKVISIVDLNLSAAVELLANRSLEETSFEFRGQEEEEEEEGDDDDDHEEEEENNSKWMVSARRVRFWERERERERWVEGEFF